MAQNKITLNLPSNLSYTERERIADLAIERIRERTNKGVDMHGEAFRAYSQTYRDSDNYKNAHKSGLVNLRLTNEMMNDLEQLGDSPNAVTIGFEAGSDANDKASWAKASDNGPRREFLGINQAELQDIISQVKGETSRTNVTQLVRAELGSESKLLSSFLSTFTVGADDGI